MEVRIALEELTAAVDSYEVPTADDLRWNKSFQLRAIKALPFRPHLRAGTA